MVEHAVVCGYQWTKPVSVTVMVVLMIIVFCRVM